MSQTSLQPTPLKIALAGLGTVGSAVLNLLQKQADLLAKRCNRHFEVVAIASRRQPSWLDNNSIIFYTDAYEMAQKADYDILIEVIGGTDGIALQIVTTALTRGKAVVTANKAMMAHHATRLANLAEQHQTILAFEASVAGGIPIIKALREGLSANQIHKIIGILNGTCNYILTTMEKTGCPFAEVLQQAQELGYAESDPSFDIDGIDTAHKLALLAGLAFSTPIQLDKIQVQGIRHISALDIKFAAELGFKIKLLGFADCDENGVYLSVHPCMIPLSFPLAHVDGVTNAVMIEGDFVGKVVFEGAGAGGNATASAVIADVVDIARGHHSPIFGMSQQYLTAQANQSDEKKPSAYYIRLMVKDQPGVFADIAAALRDENVSMEQIIQRSRDPIGIVPVVMVVHQTSRLKMQRAMDKIAHIPALAELPHVIKIEDM